MLFEEGDESNGLYLIYSGTVGGKLLGANLTKQHLNEAIISKRSFFGEIGFFLGIKRSATIYTQSHCMLLFLDIRFKR